MEAVSVARSFEAVGNGGYAMPAVKRRVLLVDDHELVRAGIRTLYQNLDEIDIHWIEAGSLQEGLQAYADQESIDAVLLDLNLGDCKGLQGLRQFMGTPLALALAYAAFGMLWILLSDRLLQQASADLATLSALAQGKGIAFVLLTSGLIYLVAARRQRAATRRTPPDLGDAHELNTHERPLRLMGVFALPCVAIVAASLISYASNASRDHAEHIDRLHREAQAKTNLVQGWIERRVREARQLAADPTLRGSLLRRRELREKKIGIWRCRDPGRHEHLGVKGPFVDQTVENPRGDTGLLRNLAFGTHQSIGKQTEHAMARRCHAFGKWTRHPDSHAFAGRPEMLAHAQTHAQHHAAWC